VSAEEKITDVMRFLRRKWRSSAADPQAAAAAFWMRWDALLPQISAALGEGEPHLVEHQLCEAVAAMHPDLHFSLEQGERARYALVVTGQGDAALRPFTDAWIAMAPPTGPLWEFHDAVPPVPDPTQVTVTVEAQRLPLADVRVAVVSVYYRHDPSRGRPSSCDVAGAGHDQDA
jgi:hypothetical protein